ncbi:MAG: N-acetylmuramoyl-L-alanine amidase [Blastocatellia bacterium]|nr:N-acetylmuramoyl-L-alanine amidase [Blastocatellia bacterium]
MQELKLQNIRNARLVDQYARYIKSPVQRLKFLNRVLQAEQPTDFMARIPFVGSLPQRMMLVVELSKVLPPDHPAPFGIRVTSLLYRLRYALYALCLLLVLGVGGGLIYTVLKLVTSLPPPTEARAIDSPPSPTANPEAVGAVANIGSEAGLSLDKVWLAESGEGYEFYSNGARVLTEFETTGQERRFYRFDLESLDPEPGELKVESKPVGILYHISESDLLPFAGDYNSSLQYHSRSLLEYSRDHRLYNYVIDRFGRTYRIVRDEFTSNHAGNSVWADGDKLYVNLSPSFIGVCFEGQSGAEAVGPDRINEAQIYAARVLTVVLRSKYSIEDANCVTHGLVSVNPSNRLMGYHTDWVSGFPFEALGLSNKYETEMAAISRLGFSYDQAYIRAAGGTAWPGLERADAALKEAARERGLSPEEERRALRQIFQRLYSKQRSLDQESVKIEE